MTISADTWRWAFVALGVLLRLFHWAADAPVWHDEAALILNVLALDFREYLGPLAYHQAAPPLFLALERLTLLALGDSERALRVPSLLAGCAALVVFATLGRRMLSAGPAALATALFALSDRLVWHSQEAKPYAFDVLVASVVVWGYLRTRRQSLPIQCLLWAIALPVALWLSYPACFVAGGLLLALLPEARQADWRGRLAYACVGLAVMAAFGAVVLGPAAAQRDPVLSAYWADRVADWDRPASIPGVLGRGTVQVARYSLLPLGQLLIPVAVVGAIRFGRADGRLLILLVTPVALNVVAALIGKYPFGSGRVNAFLAPAVLLLIAAGVPPTWVWLRARWRYAPILLAVLLLAPLWPAALCVVVPWPRPDFRAAVASVDAVGRDDPMMAGYHWEVRYYTRGQPGRVWEVEEVVARRPARLWVLTGIDARVRDVLFGRVPPDWVQVEVREFRGVLAARYERRDAGGSTPPAGSVP